MLRVWNFVAHNFTMHPVPIESYLYNFNKKHIHIPLSERCDKYKFGKSK